MNSLENIPDNPHFSLGGHLSITKIFRFEMAHALSNYTGPCSQLHGHSYHLEVSLTQLSTPDFISEDQQGMIIDFSVLKKIVEEVIISKVDHALILNKDTKDSLIKELNAVHSKLLLVPFSPTNENLLLWFVQTLSAELKEHNLHLEKMRLYETETSFAEWGCGQ